MAKMVWLILAQVTLLPLFLSDVGLGEQQEGREDDVRNPSGDASLLLRLCASSISKKLSKPTNRPVTLYKGLLRWDIEVTL